MSGLVTFFSTWCRLHCGRAIAVALVVLGLLGCDRASVSLLATGPELPDADSRVFSVELQPNYFSIVSDNPPRAEVIAAGSLFWEGGKLTEPIDETAELILGPLDTEFVLTQLRLEPEDGNLRVLGEYSSQRLLTTARVDVSANTFICDVVIDYQPRTLEFVLAASSDDGIPQWTMVLERGFVAEDHVSVVQVGDCTYPLQDIDWNIMSDRVNALLAGEANSTFMPHVRDVVLSQMSLPGAGILVEGQQTGFFDPVDVQVSMQTAATPPWDGSGFQVVGGSGVKIAMDALVEGDDAPCVDGVRFDDVDVLPLDTLPEEELSPGGSAFEIRAAVSTGLMDQVVTRLLGAGHGCGDFDMGTTLPRLRSIFPEVTDASLVAFGQSGRVRMQPLGSASLTALGENRVLWDMPLRFDVYGDVDDIELRLARVDAEMSFEVALETDADGVLVLRPLNISATAMDSDLSLLEQTNVSLTAQVTAERMVSVLLSDVVRLPLPRPFGYRLEILEVVEASGGWMFYLRLRS